MSPFDTLIVGAQLAQVASDLIALYADDQMAMIEWAFDWSLPNDLFDGPIIMDDPDLYAMELSGENMAMAGFGPGTLKGGYRAARALVDSGGWRFGQVFRTTSAARAAKAGRGMGLRAQAHHLIPISFARIIKVTTNGPGVILGKKHHQVYTTRLNRALDRLKTYRDIGPRKTDAQLKAFALKEISKAYSSRPKWMNAIEGLLR